MFFLSLLIIEAAQEEAMCDRSGTQVPNHHTWSAREEREGGAARGVGQMSQYEYEP